MSLLTHLVRVGREAFFPATCSCCRQLFKAYPIPDFETTPISMPGSNKLKAHVCPRCIHQFHRVTSPLCSSCGVPFDSPYGPDHVCPHCEQKSHQFSTARAYGRYDDALRALIHQYKYHGREWLAEPLGYLLWEALRCHFQPSLFDHVIPVPLHRKRLHQRGFNQAALLIYQWPAMARKNGWNPPAQWIVADMLARRRQTLPQTGLNPKQRADNMRLAFQIARTLKVNGKRILLIDDVMTTGATADACALVLRQAGAYRVDVLTLARAV